MIIFVLLFVVAYFGDYERKELKKDYEDYNRIVKVDKNEK